MNEVGHDQVSRDARLYMIIIAGVVVLALAVIAGLLINSTIRKADGASVTACERAVLQDLDATAGRLYDVELVSDNPRTIQGSIEVDLDLGSSWYDWTCVADGASARVVRMEADVCCPRVQSDSRIRPFWN